MRAALVDEGDEGLVLLGQRGRQRLGPIEQLAELLVPAGDGDADVVDAS